MLVSPAGNASPPDTALAAIGQRVEMNTHYGWLQPRPKLQSELHEAKFTSDPERMQIVQSGLDKKGPTAGGVNTARE
jgi:hypothetical protein